MLYISSSQLQVEVYTPAKRLRNRATVFAQQHRGALLTENSSGKE